MSKNLDAALAYLAAGLSVIPIKPDGTKSPNLNSWKQYQERAATEAQARKWFASGKLGVAILAGRVSGNLTVIDFDTKEAYEHFDALRQQLAPHLSTMPVVSTPNGYHVYVRTSTAPQGNQKLALDQTQHAIIETRGEGGYVLAPGSPPQCHPTARPYLLEHGDLCDIPLFAVDNLEALFEIGRAFNTFVPAIQATAPPKGHNRHDRTGLSPGDDYNERGNWRELLERQGAVRVAVHGEEEYWRRPGKTLGHSATFNFAGSGLLKLMSPNWRPFEDGETYSPFAIYTTLEHNSDYSAAAKALAAQGYGDPPQPRPKPKNGSTPDTDSAQSEPDYHFTDTGNAQRFVDQHAENIRYVHSWESWFIWHGNRWAIDDTGAIRRYAKDTVRSIHEQADNADFEQRAPLRKWALACEQLGRMKSMIETAQSNPGVPITPEDLDNYPMLLNCKNGILDLETARLRPHDRKLMLTKLAPVAYDPDADCPKWYAFLEYFLDRDTDTINWLQRMIGFTLTGDHRRRPLTILSGAKGRNGKTTLIETIHRMMGDYAMAASPDMFVASAQKTDQQIIIGRLKGARFVSSKEPNEGWRLDEGLLKYVTGADTVTGRLYYKDAFDFMPSFKVFMATNHLPDVRGVDEGLWDRIQIVPFEIRIPDNEVDPNFGAKLLQELPGILAWAARGALEWQRDGLGTSPAMREYTADFKTQVDKIGKFIEDRCVLEEGSQQRATDLYQAYKNWCAETGERYVESQTAFGRRLTDRGIKHRKSDGVIVRMGIALLNASRLIENTWYRERYDRDT